MGVNVPLKVYGDESADGKQSRVFVLAAIFGTEDEWAQATQEWLRRTRGHEFHASVCEWEFAEHQDKQKHKDNQKLYKDVTQVLAKSYLCGVSVAFDLASMKDCLGFSPVKDDLAYRWCFKDVIEWISERVLAFTQNSSNPYTLPFQVTFDARLQSEGIVGRIYSEFQKQSEWRDAEIFKASARFEPGPDPRLEMPDLLAREAMKELDRKITESGREPRKSYEALAAAEKNGVKQFTWIVKDRAYWERWRDAKNTPESKDMLKRYQEWLSETKRADNLPNRTRFTLEH